MQQSFNGTTQQYLPIANSCLNVENFIFYAVLMRIKAMRFHFVFIRSNKWIQESTKKKKKWKIVTFGKVIYHLPRDERWINMVN